MTQESTDELNNITELTFVLRDSHSITVTVATNKILLAVVFH